MPVNVKPNLPTRMPPPVYCSPSNATDVASRELIYMHDTQLLLQNLVIALMGKTNFDLLPLSYVVKTKDDYFEFNG